MTDRDVVEEFCRVVGCGSVGPEKRLRPPQTKTVHVWTIANRDDVERILLALLPHFGSRRTEKALTALAEIKQRRAECIRTCDFCGVEFEAKRELARFCSTAHQQGDYYERHGNVRVSERAVA